MSEAPRINKDDVKDKLSQSDFIILDCRKKSDFEKSDTKIKGAVYEDPAKIDEWIGKYPVNSNLVIYCA
jgi:hypothetical protein